jgi:hypothetical protein
VAEWLIAGLLVGVIVLLGALCAALRRTAVALEKLARHAATWSERAAPAPALVGVSPPAAPDAEGPPLARPTASTVETQAREALTRRAWIEAARLIDNLRTNPTPGSIEQAERLLVEMDRARDAQSTDLKARLEAARAANDPEAVLDLHAELATLIAADARADADRELVGWFMRLLMRRMRTGTVGPDVARLAERVSGAFPATVEGASLRASLPTLRRSAGLCAVCATPYSGAESACPKCLAARLLGQPPAGSAVSVDAEEVEPEPNPDDHDGAISFDLPS